MTAGDEPLVYTSFTMDCPTCGPGAIVFKDGVRQPHPCPYEEPALVIENTGEISVEELQRRVVQSLEDGAALEALEGDEP